MTTTTATQAGTGADPAPSGPGLPGVAGRGRSAAASATTLLGELLVTLGLLLLLFTAWQLWWTDVVADRAQAQTTQALLEHWSSPGEATAAEPGPVPAPAATPVPALADPEPGEPFGVVHVPRFGAAWQPRPLVEGTGVAELEAGVGHYPGTALPGEVGNVAVAGHRNTYGKPFHGIAELREGDAVVLETAEGWFVYRATTHEVVRPDQVEVVAPVPGRPGTAPTERMLTMTACHPIASARERYVQHAVLDRFVPRSAGPPSELAGESAGGTTRADA